MPPRWLGRERYRRKRVFLVVETSTDVRLVDGLSEFVDLTLVVPARVGGAAVNHASRAPVPVIRLRGGRLGFAAKLVAWLRSTKPKPDVVLVQGYGVGALAANIAGRLEHIPTVMLVCSPHEEYYRCRTTEVVPSRPFRGYELLLIEAIARLNAWVGQEYVVLSRYLADTIRRYSRNKPVSICPVYGVDTSVFVRSRRPKAELRQDLGLPKNGSIIFFSSRIAPEKDVDALLRATAVLVNEGRNVWLVNLSGGYMELRSEAEGYKIQDRVIARPPVDPRGELVAYYQAADLCVQASRAEGLGFSVLEALACGIPVVAADVGGLRETTLEGRTGWTYPPGDVEALVDAIRCVLEDPSEASRRAGRGRAVVVCRYGRQVAFGRLRALLEELS